VQCTSSEEGHRASKALNGVDRAEQRGFGACKLQWPTDTPSGCTSECPHRTALLNALPLLLGQPRLHAPATTRRPLSPLTLCPCPALPCPALPCPGLSKSPTAPPRVQRCACTCQLCVCFLFNNCTLADHAKHDTGTLETVLILLAHSRRVSFFLSLFLSFAVFRSVLSWMASINYTEKQLRLLLLLVQATPPRARKSSRARHACVRACTVLPLPYSTHACPCPCIILTSSTTPAPSPSNTKAPSTRKTPPAPSRPRQRPSWEAQAIIAALDLSSTLSPPILE
jgi:hypothetical protein